MVFFSFFYCSNPLQVTGLFFESLIYLYFTINFKIFSFSRRVRTPELSMSEMHAYAEVPRKSSEHAQTLGTPDIRQRQQGLSLKSTGNIGNKGQTTEPFLKFDRQHGAQNR